MMDNTRDLRVLIASRYPLVMAESKDEVRFMSMLRRAAAAASDIPVWTWTATQGLRQDTSSDSAYQTVNADKALQFIQSSNQPGVFVFNDIQRTLENEVFLRRVKDIAQAATPGITIVLAVPALNIPKELTGLALPWKLEPPTREEVAEIVRRNVDGLKERGTSVTLSDEELEEMVDACRGLSAAEVGQLVVAAALDDGKIDGADIGYVREAKAQLLGAGGILELIETSSSLDQVGGLDKLKDWLKLRGKAFQADAKDFGIESPRGVLLTGVPGCGKSLVARTLARTWKMALLLLDPARLYGPFVGESEQHLRDSLATVEAMAPAVLWIDEIEKGLAAGSEADSGVSQRLRGTFLRWMQDHPPGVFLVATCNEVESLPPEFLRRGRFDEIFFVDLPEAAEREQIFKLHLTRRKRDPAKFDTASLATACEGFSGAEIEATVVGALYRAFGTDRDITTEDILAEIQGTVPLSRTRAEDIDRLRAWAKGRTVPAS